MLSPVGRYRLHTALALLLMLGLCAAGHWAFERWAGQAHWRWYVAAGPFVALATASFAVAWGQIDRQTGLISAQPLDYLGACLQMVSLPLYVLGGHLRAQPGGPRLWDFLCFQLLLLAFVLAALAWLLLIAPLQYFVFLVCAAPSRIALRSTYRVQARLVDGRRLEWEDLPLDTPAPSTGWDASLRDKPVTLASAFSAALLFLIGVALG